MAEYLVFETRAEAVAASSEGAVANGSYAAIGGLKYVYAGAGAVIPDMPGWQPSGDIVKPEHFGAAPEAYAAAAFEDQTDKLQAMLDWASAQATTVLWSPGVYGVTSLLRTQLTGECVRWRSEGNVHIRSLKTSPTSGQNGGDYILKVEADTFKAGVSLDANLGDVQAGDTTLPLPDTSSILPYVGHLLLIYSTRVIDTDNRSQAVHGWGVPISRVIRASSASEVGLVQCDKPHPVTLRNGDITGVSVASIAGTHTLAVAGLEGYAREECLYRITFNTVGGSAPGEDLGILPMDYDPSTQTFTFSSLYSSGLPAGLIEGDSLTITRRVSIIQTRGAALDIDGEFTFIREPHSEAEPGDQGFRGVWIDRAYRPILNGIAVINFSESGLKIDNSYAPEVHNIKVSGANRAYGSGDGTGYGVTVVQSSWGIFENIIGSNNRRTLDFGGTQQTSYHNIVRNVTNEGGGYTYTGERFWPYGAVTQSAVGSHGAAWFTRYLDCKGFNIYGVVFMRGSDEVVDGVYGAGKMHALISCAEGDGFTATNLYYDCGVPDWVSNDSLAYGSHYGPDFARLESVAAIMAGRIIPTKPHFVGNIFVKGLSGQVIEFTRSGKVGPVIVGGVIDLVTDNVSGDNENLYLINTSEGVGAVDLNGPIVVTGNVNILNRPSAPKALINVCPFSYFTFKSGSYLKHGDKVICTMDNDSVVKLPILGMFQTIRVSLRYLFRDRSHIANDLIIQVGRSGYLNSGMADVGANFDVLATELTGTTGAAGRISLSYVNNYLYVEWRTGSSQHIVITCDSFA